MADAAVAAAVPAPAKHDDLIYDLGLLAASDMHPLDPAALAADREGTLLRAATENVQLLLKHIFELPAETAPDVGPVVVLPARTTRLPRQLPPPQKAEPTTWEKFAAEKGITKKKRSRMVLDEAADDWKPRWGYKRAKDASSEWLYELKAGDDAAVDHIERRELLKQQRVVQNKLSAVNNKERAAGAVERRAGSANLTTAIVAGGDDAVGPTHRKKQRRGGRDDGSDDAGGAARPRLPAGIPSIPIAEGRADAVSGPGKQRRFAPTDSKGTKQAQLRMAQVSTGSLGKFDRTLAGEPTRPKVAQRVARLPNEVSHKTEQSRDARVLQGIIAAAEGGGAGHRSGGAPLEASGYKAKKAKKREAAQKPRAPKGSITSSGFKSGGGGKSKNFKKGGGHAPKPGKGGKGGKGKPRK